MKQVAMNDKIKKCKTCEKQCMQEDLDQLRGVEKLSSCYRAKTQKSRWIEELSRIYQVDRELGKFP